MSSPDFRYAASFLAGNCFQRAPVVIVLVHTESFTDVDGVPIVVVEPSYFAVETFDDFQQIQFYP